MYCTPSYQAQAYDQLPAFLALTNEIVHKLRSGRVRILKLGLVAFKDVCEDGGAVESHAQFVGGRGVLAVI